jgi:hypothetical protein
MMPEITNRHSKPTCRVVWAGTEFTGKQALLYAPGISAESVGAQRIHLQIVTIPPGGRAKAHKHEAHETAIHVLSGLSGMWYGEKLEAGRTEPGIEQSCRGIAVFIGTRSIGLIPVPGDTPLGLGIPEMSEGSPSVRWFGFGVCVQITRLFHLCRNTEYPHDPLLSLVSHLGIC